MKSSISWQHSVVLGFFWTQPFQKEPFARCGAQVIHFTSIPTHLLPARLYYCSLASAELPEGLPQCWELAAKPGHSCKQPLLLIPRRTALLLTFPWSPQSNLPIAGLGSWSHTRVKILLLLWDLHIQKQIHRFLLAAEELYSIFNF